MLNPSRYRILSIGKIKKNWIKEGIQIYLKRLPGLTITELRNSNKKKEAELIKSLLGDTEILIVLMENGNSLTSIGLAQYLEKIGSQRLTFVIGGPDGVSSELKKLAHFQLSLSPLTFPHEMARLLLVEQLYRAVNITQGGVYHRD